MTIAVLFVIPACAGMTNLKFMGQQRVLCPIRTGEAGSGRASDTFEKSRDLFVGGRLPAQQ